MIGKPVEVQGGLGTAVFKVFDLQVARKGLNVILKAHGSRHEAKGSSLSKVSKRIWRVFLVQISGIYLIFFLVILLVSLVLFYPKLEDFFVFYPETSFEVSPQQFNLEPEEVFFKTKDHQKLHGWFFSSSEEASVLLFYHGNAGNISHRLENIRVLLDRRFSVFIFDYRGYGKSTGKPSEKGIYLDGLAAYDFLVNRKHILPNRVVPFGRSLGASVAVEIALQREVRSLIIESAFTCTKDMAGTLFLFKLFSFFLPPHYNNLAKIPHISAPKLIIHGQKDELVPFSMGQRLFLAAKTPKSFLPIRGAGHNDTYIVGGRTYFETLAAFIKNPRTMEGALN